MSRDFDFFVIGAGSGGVRAARIAAQHGARVGIAEERYFGGTCVNVGCVPKKLMVFGASYSRDFADAAGFGWTVPRASHDWATLIANKDAEIARLAAIYRRLLEGAGVRIHESRAVLEDQHTIRMGDERVTADRILIATGGWPVLPDIPGVKEHAITSNEVFFLEERPQRVVIVGGGYIGVEFAGIFAGLGSAVTQLYRGKLILRGFDDDLREGLAAELKRGGIDLRHGMDVERVERTGECLMVTTTDGRVIEADCVLYATGRRANTAGLGLETAGVVLSDTGGVVVDEESRSNIPHIFAVGDVTERVALTPVAIASGHALADTLFGGRPRTVPMRNIPSAVFSIPPLATVGLTEAEARRQYPAVDIYRTSFLPMRNVLSGREERTLMKLVVDRASDRVLGCHMLGPDSPEIIQGLAIALNCGATKAQFDETIGLHPTVAEEFVTMRTRSPDPEPASPIAT